jgi:hypothetical protein
MAPRLKQDYPALIAEYDQRVSAGERPQAIKAAFQERGIHWGTFQNHRTHAKKTQPSQIQETPMSLDEAPVEVLPGQMGIESTDTPLPDPGEVLPIGNNLPVVSNHTGPLSTDESGVLEYYERIIEHGVKTFVEVGHALTVIRDQRLYRERYETFDTYLRERWDLERTYAHRIIEASEVMNRLLPIGNILPVNEAQARPLAGLPPEQQVEVWQEAVKTAPAGKVTAKHVQATVKRVKGSSTEPKTAKPKAPAPELKPPSRERVQDGLFEVLSMVKDEDAWTILGEIALALDTYAEEHEDPNLMERMVQALSPLWHLIEDHEATTSHTSDVSDSEGPV